MIWEKCSSCQKEIQVERYNHDYPDTDYYRCLYCRKPTCELCKAEYHGFCKSCSEKTIKLAELFKILSAIQANQRYGFIEESENK